jgi:hypothetical protein
MSLRGIVEETSLSLQTVRTILDRDVLLDRGSRKILQRIAPDHLAEKLFRAKQAGRKALPKRIDVWLKDVDRTPKVERAFLGRYPHCHGSPPNPSLY